MTSNQALYNQIITDHYHAPRRQGVLHSPDIDITRSNESCGDTIHITVTVKNGIITDIKQEGNGCVISQAYASLLAQHALNKPIQELLNFSDAAFLELAFMYLGPQRAQCALLPLKALKEGLQKYHA